MCIPVYTYDTAPAGIISISTGNHDRTNSPSRETAEAVAATACPAPQIRVAPTWRPGDRVRWQGYTGTFLRETVDDQAEVLIGTRTLRLPKTELRSAGQR